MDSDAAVNDEHQVKLCVDEVTSESELNADTATFDDENLLSTKRQQLQHDEDVKVRHECFTLQLTKLLIMRSVIDIERKPVSLTVSDLDSRCELSSTASLCWK